MTVDEMREIIGQCKYADYEFLVGEKNGVPFLQKPYSAAQLLRTVREVLNS